VQLTLPVLKPLLPSKKRSADAQKMQEFIA